MINKLTSLALIAGTLTMTAQSANAGYTVSKLSSASAGGTLYVLNTVSGKISFCFPVTTATSTTTSCSTAGSFPNPTSSTIIVNEPSSGAAYIEDAGIVMRCSLNYTKGNISGATCAAVNTVPLP